MFLLVIINARAFALSGTEYLTRFQKYQYWNEHLPTTAEPEFIHFIAENAPLSNRLRNKWLYQLAQNKNWPGFLQYYVPSNDTSLQCYQLLAIYYSGQSKKAIESARGLWLVGHSQPPACNRLFDILRSDDAFEEALITQRIALALAEKNVSLARHLLKSYKIPKRQEADALTDIHFHPNHIERLLPGQINSELYLYGLNRMIATNLDHAILYWHHNKTHQLLNEKQQQSFLSQVAIYKAMRNQADTHKWFAKIKPMYYHQTLLDWQLRYALKQQRWHQVETLFQYSQDKENPYWQYWLARAIEAQGRKEEARPIYDKLAVTRNYYGFLASMRLHKKLSFENEAPIRNMQLLKPYQPITDEVKSLYFSNQTLQASRLLNDFVLELPKEDKSALIYWLAHVLQWYGKAVNLSNNDELTNQLALRFPLAYQPIVKQYAQTYQLPEELIYAIIRQESTFREDVISSAGAHGLMQVMPTTAKAIAQMSHIDYADQKQLLLPFKNIHIGSAYLQQLTKRFKHHPVLIAAAYNAGPKQVGYWLQNHPVKPMDIWIETLPWYETRNYIKNVVAFYAVYQYRMQKNPDIRHIFKPVSQ